MTGNTSGPLGQVLDPFTILAPLSKRRRVFHSEADFQFAFAWEAKVIRPDLEVRLETHPEPNVRLDLELIDPASGSGVAVELKYMTRLWAGADRGETFALKNHGASDLRGYDVVKDVARVERFVAARPGWCGFVIVLTNEPAYWRPKTHGRATNADAFRLHEGAVLAGQRAWGPLTGGTAKGREQAIDLRGRYVAHWSDYARLDSSPAGTFRLLVIPVGTTEPTTNEEDSTCSTT